MVRKIKPRKPREIKINETKKIEPAPVPSQLEIQELEARTHLMNLSVVVGKHKAIWDKEIKEHDRYLNPYYRSLIGRVRNLTDKLYNELYPAEDDEDVEVTPYISALMVKFISICAPAFGDPIPLSPEDKKQRLPAGFTGTLYVWAKLIILLGQKLFPYFVKLNKDKEIALIVDLSTRYMCYLARDIIFKEELIDSWEANMGRKFEKGRTLDKDFEMVKTKPKKSKEEEFLERVFKDDIKELDNLEKQNKNRRVEEKSKMEEKPVKKDIKNVKPEEKTVKIVENDIKTAEKFENCDNPVKPSHYVLKNGLSAGDVIEFVIKDCKGRTAWKLGTVLKYIIRAERKAGVVDYQKAQEYISMILDTDYWEEEISITGSFREEFEREYGKSWFSVLYSIVENMPGGKALAVNEIFECLINKNLIDAKKRIQDVLSFK